MIGGEQLGREWFVAMADLTGALDKNTIAALQTANANRPGSGNFPYQQLLQGEEMRGGQRDTSYQAYLADAKARAQPAFDRYQADLAGASDRYGANRMAILDDFQK